MKKKPSKPTGKAPKKEGHYSERWKNPDENKMGNDITGDMKIANSHGELEGGQEKRGPLQDDDRQ